MKIKNRSNTGKLRRWISPLTISVLFVMGWACSCMGQASLTKEDTNSKNWSRLFQLGISSNGEWINYTVLYDTLPDTLIVANTQNNKRYGFAKGSYGQFNEQGSRFALLHPEKGVGVLNLDTGLTEWFKGGNLYKFTLNGKGIAIMLAKKGKRGKAGIVYMRFADHKSVFMANSREAVFSAAGDYLAIATKEGGIDILETQNLKQHRLPLPPKTSCYFPVWSPTGHQLALLTKTQQTYTVQVWNPKHSKDYQTLTNGRVLKTGIPIAKQAVFFSNDGSTLFFYRENIKPNTSENDVNVEVWKGNDKWLYPRQQIDYNPADQGLLTAWSLKTDSLRLLATPEHPATVLGGNQEYAMNYNILDYTPEYTQFSYSDLYCTDINTGKQLKALSKQYLAYNYNKFSPGGRYWAFYKDDNWWVYDMQLHTTTNVTEHLPVGVTDKEDDYAGPLASYGCPGWTEGDTGLIVYSRYDVWAVKPDGSSFQRLTLGEEKEVTYRLYNNFSSAYPHHRYPYFEGGVFSLSSPLLLSGTTQEGRSDFYHRLPGGEIEVLTTGVFDAGHLKKAADKNIYVYIQESYNMPARLMLKKGHEKPQIKYQSNALALKENPVSCQRIRYTDSKGNKLGGILYYPDPYDPQKKYPMIVSIYERQSGNFYKYIVPTDFPTDGFNVKTYTRAGYMVLLPDIAYTLGMPGLSAVECVTKAVNTVIEMGLVFPDRIGLIGHSFGGYETSFIISQTSMFKTAVAGAPTTDLTSYYHSIYGNAGTSQQWRYENQQFRMGVPYFQDKEAYLRNSPINYADKIKTPLFIWAGKDDGNINPTQSVELYLALRRKETPVSMLLYPGESHSLLEQENQKDLSIRIKQWFDLYLK